MHNYGLSLSSISIIFARAASVNSVETIWIKWLGCRFLELFSSAHVFYDFTFN
jgi:hypothetical protein